MLCGFYKLCQSGDAEKVREKLDQLPAASTHNSVQSQVTPQEVNQVWIVLILTYGKSV